MTAAFGARTSVRSTVRTNERVGIIRSRTAWRALKRAEARAPIPTGLRPKAQGCEARATLGDVPKHFPQPQRGCGPTTNGLKKQCVGISDMLPRTATIRKFRTVHRDGPTSKVCPILEASHA